MRRPRFQVIGAMLAASLMVFSSGGGAFAASAKDFGFTRDAACVHNAGGSSGGSGSHNYDGCEGSSRSGGFEGGSHGGQNDDQGENNNGDKSINATGLARHACAANEWRFSISGLKKASDAPATITVIWKNGAQADAPLAKVNGRTAYYTTTANLGSTLVGVAAKIDGDWSGKFEVDHGPCAQQVLHREGTDPITLGVSLPCGLLTFNGTLNWSQHFIYNEQKGTLHFQFAGKVNGTAAIGDDTYEWNSYSMEQDLLSLTGMAGKTGFNADGAPNLDPYGGSLKNWLADPDNLDQVILVHLVFEDRLRTSGKKGQTVLLNHVVMKANAKGLSPVETEYFDHLCT